MRSAQVSTPMIPPGAAVLQASGLSHAPSFDNACMFVGCRICEKITNGYSMFKSHKSLRHAADND